MSQEDVDRLRAAYEAYNRRGVEAVFELIDPDFEAETAPELSAEPDVYRGYEGIRRYFSSFEEVMEGIRFEPEEFIDASDGEHVVVFVRVHARGKGSRFAMDEEVADVFAVRDGRISELRLYMEREKALALVGS